MLEFTGGVADGETGKAGYNTVPMASGGSGGPVDFAAGSDDVSGGFGPTGQHQTTHSPNMSGPGFDSIEPEPKY